jgi:ribA/ribD-fused uncharacterized protein
MNYRFFWSGSYPESNFYIVNYTSVRDINFVCSEQGYMYEKAIHFCDYDMADKILRLTDPGHIKKAGRLVKNFNEQEWQKVKVDRMLFVLRDKFKVPEMRNHLLSTDYDILVEASPYDSEWGIGLDAKNAYTTPMSEWPGKNLLGKCLMLVREEKRLGF